MLRSTLRLRMIFLFCLVIGVFLASTYWMGLKILEREAQAALDEKLLDIGRLVAVQLVEQSGNNVIGGLEPAGQFLERIDSNGIVLETSANLRPAELNLGPPPATPQVSLRTVTTRLGTMRVAVLPITVRQHHERLIVAELTAPLNRLQARLRERAFGLWTVSLLLTTMIAASYVGRSLAPIVELNKHAAILTQQATTASYQEFTARLPIANPNDELGQLAINFNRLFSTIESVVLQLRQFVSDAAHELRTPLSVLRGETQFLLSQQRSLQQYQDTLQTIDIELAAMAQIIDGLFTLSMADAGQLAMHEEPLYLDEVFEEACGIITPVARRKRIRLERTQWEEVKYLGDQTLLRQVLLILLENAIKYSSFDTTIQVSIRLVDNHPEILVSDEGIGISPEHLPHIFKRFYRAAPQATEGPRGGGLGLAIADAIMHAHQGSVCCVSEVNKGSAFTLIFPEASESFTECPPLMSK
jgi:signal transduction histidine kinase